VPGMPQQASVPRPDVAGAGRATPRQRSSRGRAVPAEAGGTTALGAGAGSAKERQPGTGGMLLRAPAR
jgi:hypothetical protein